VRKGEKGKLGLVMPEREEGDPLPGHLWRREQVIEGEMEEAGGYGWRVGRSWWGREGGYLTL
jgi:hypothetical protein